MVSVFYLTQTTVSNAWNSAYFPISAYISFDNTGSPYVARNIITNGVFDPVKYAAYSPVFISTTQALACGIAFAAFPAVFIHTFCKILSLCVLLDI